MSGLFCYVSTSRADANAFMNDEVGMIAQFYYFYALKFFERILILSIALFLF
jgi:hypothetical protein